MAGKPEKQLPGANGVSVWADGYRPTDGAAVDAKNVREQGCSPRTLDRLHEGDFGSQMLAEGDSEELARYKQAIDNKDGHVQYLELDTNARSTTGYWQFLCAAGNVPNNVRYTP